MHSPARGVADANQEPSTGTQNMSCPPLYYLHLWPHFKTLIHFSLVFSMHGRKNIKNVIIAQVKASASQGTWQYVVFWCNTVKDLAGGYGGGWVNLLDLQYCKSTVHIWSHLPMVTLAWPKLSCRSLCELWLNFRDSNCVS